MNIVRNCWISILFLMLCTACGQEEANFPQNSENGGLELCIRFTGDFNMNSRSELNTSEPQHHIEHMYAYIFTNSEGSTIDGFDEATCIYEEKLPWQPSVDAASVFRCRLQAGAYQAIEKQNSKDKNFLVMVVGVDNHPETYSFPTSSGTSAADMHLGMIGKKLNSVELKLSASDPQLMSYTELFAGYSKFTTANSLINVHLTRRVAGVLCYLKDLPAIINGYHIIGVELHCNYGVNRSGVLMPDLTNDENEFAQLTADSKQANQTLLASVDLKELGAEADASGSLLYIPPIKEEGVLETLPNTVLLGAYMLPIKEGAQFSIRLKGETRDADGKVTGDPYIFKATDTDGYYIVNNKSGQIQYPLKPDYIYQIGSKPYAANTDYDAPLSLKGKAITVAPKKWEEREVNVDFSSTQFGMVISSKRLANYKYDCMFTSDSLQVKVLSEIYRNANWTLTVEANAEVSTDWLWLYDDKGNKVKTIEGNGEKDIRIHIDNFIDANSKNRDNPDEDFREARLVLQLKNDPLRSSIPIRQWNALIVTTCDNDNKKQWNIAFSRLDSGAIFNNDGTENRDSLKTYEWAYDGIYVTSIFDQGTGSNTGYDGLYNYSALYLERNRPINKGQWDKSVVNLAHISSPSGDQDDDWYVPSRIEMNAMLHKMYGFDSANLHEDGTWWTSTLHGGSKHLGYIGKPDIVNKNKWWTVKDYSVKRLTKHTVRLAHKIPAKKAE